MIAFDEMMVRYEALASVTRRMRDAAGESDWEWLMSMQAEYSRLVDALRPGDVDVPLDAQQRARKHDVIRRILDDDAHIRERIDPQLARLSALMATGRQTRAVQSAYGLRSERGRF